jgi:Zn-finger nucleic acid-binding protein
MAKLLKPYHPAMGHHYNENMECENGRCIETWDSHQLNPQPCEFNDPEGKRSVYGSGRASRRVNRLCTAYSEDDRVTLEHYERSKKKFSVFAQIHGYDPAELRRTLRRARDQRKKRIRLGLEEPK